MELASATNTNRKSGAAEGPAVPSTRIRCKEKGRVPQVRQSVPGPKMFFSNAFTRSQTEPCARNQTAWAPTLTKKLIWTSLAEIAQNASPGCTPERRDLAEAKFGFVSAISPQTSSAPLPAVQDKPQTGRSADSDSARTSDTQHCEQTAAPQAACFPTPAIYRPEAKADSP
jgi:hypothetical protein